MTQRKWMTILGWILPIPLVGLMIFSASVKLGNADVRQLMMSQGFSEQRITVIGILEIACVVIYLVPQTAVLGAVLLTGYLGGAVVTHVRGGDGVGQYLSPAIFGVIFWLGLFLRDPRIRTLLPFRCLRACKTDAPSAN